jgi:hypothetical protein
LALRVTEERRRSLEAAAAKSGRSISQEIEIRLEQSFRDEAALGGREMTGLFQMMAGAAVIAEERHRKKWPADSETFQAVREAWLNLLDDFGPALPSKWKEIVDCIDKGRRELVSGAIASGDSSDPKMMRAVNQLLEAVSHIAILEEKRRQSGLREHPDRTRERETLLREGQKAVNDLFSRLAAFSKC